MLHLYHIVESFYKGEIEMDKRKEANLHVKNSIVNALIDLMREKNFEAISVSEITARAEIGRAHV